MKATYSPTRFANLVRADASGSYFIRAHVVGKYIFRSLKTKSIDIAKWKLDQELAAERARPAAASGDDATMGALIDEHMANVARSERKRVTVESLEYAAEELEVANREDNPIRDVSAAKVTPEMCEAWIAGARESYSAPRCNAIISVLRGALGLAVARGLLRVNPAAGIKCFPVVVKERELPTDAQLALLFRALKAGNGRHGAYFLASFLCYSGFRLRTARAMTPRMVDGDQFKLDGSLLKTGTPGRTYRFPILPAMKRLLKELDEAFGKEREKLLPTASAWSTLRKTCAALRIPNMNHHAFRHVFSTAAIAAGVPVPIIADWRGDSDGGKTLLKVYHHLLDDTSRKYAAKMKLPS